MDVIVVADDLGISPERDQGIFALAKQGRLSYASLLVNGPCAERAAQKAKQLGLPLALHFNCTEGRPLFAHHSFLVQRRECPLQIDIADSERVFPGKQLTWQQLDSASSALIDCILSELEHQIQYFERLCDTSPCCLNSHQHIHVHPSLSARIAERIAQYGVRSIRCPRERVSLAGTRQEQQIANLAVNAYADIVRYELNTTSDFWGLVSTHVPPRSESLAEYLDSCSGDTLEIMIHPGYRGTTWDAYNCSPDRELELEFYQSEEFLSIVRNANGNLRVAC